VTDCCAAAVNAEFAVVRALLDAGADATITDNAGKRAIDYARNNQHLTDTNALQCLYDASGD
jgi:ankyrin repeat protein